MKIIGVIAFLLVVIGGLNWGLVGLFNLDVIATIFGGASSAISRIIYVLIGLSALWVLFTMFPKQVAAPK